MPYIGRAPTSTATKLEDADQDTKIQVEESSDEDTIRFDIAGAEDFTMSANSLNVLTGSVLALPDGAVATPSITNTGDLNTGVYFPAADTVGVTAGGTEQFRFGSNPIPGGGKNLVINGAVNVSQRGVNAVILAGFDSTTNTYGPDRFVMSGGATPQNRGEIEHVSSGGPTGFPSFFRYDVTTAEAAMASDEYTSIQTRLEGYITNRLSWGNAAAKDVTLSFYMRSPKTGTHNVAIGQSGGRYKIKEFTVASADTWEKHSVTFSGDASGSMNAGNTEGLRIHWPIIAGSTYQGAADTWIAGGPWLRTSGGTQNLADNTSNNIDLTGVQLEIGSVATDFAHEDYGTTLQKCQRYYARWEGASKWGLSGVCRSTTGGVLGGFDFPVEMRAAPTITYTTVNVIDGSAGGVDGTLSTGGVTTKSATCSLGSSSGLTDGNGLFVELKASGVIAASAEL